MSDLAPVVAVDDQEPDSEIYHCSICLVNVISQEALDEHYVGEHHIMRSLKLYGLPIAMCFLCRRFATLSEDEHIAKHQHQIAAAKYPHFTGSPLRVIAHPTGMYTDAQRAQLFFNDEYLAVYTEHVRLHHNLFSVFQRAHAEAILAEIALNEPPSPELSSTDEELQFFTP